MVVYTLFTPYNPYLSLRRNSGINTGNGIASCKVARYCLHRPVVIPIDDEPHWIKWKSDVVFMKYHTLSEEPPDQIIS